jgi:L-alanine-DL-glutamate epimerase-like enolase superfamily enzyme
MNLTQIDRRARLERIEWARLPGRRPRAVGKNARLPHDHGRDVAPPLARVMIGGTPGIGWSMIRRETAQRLLGTSVGEMLDEQDRIKAEYRGIEFPLLDWLGRGPGHPVYGLINPELLNGAALQVPCYDTSLYMDDLGRAGSDAEAVKILQQEAAEGLQRGHLAFKMKIGRGARHMPPVEGLKRDIAVVNGVRETIGAQSTLLVDANNGLTLNQAIEFLRETASSRLAWLEEPFHEDPPLYAALRDWMKSNQVHTLLADGEGDASPHLLQWAKEGIVDVLQYDIFSPGFTRWLELAGEINPKGVKAAPHHFGAILGNFCMPHLAPALAGFLFVEWDEATIDGLDVSAYRIADGRIEVPNRPGFALELDAAHFAGRVRDGGWAVGH